MAIISFVREFREQFAAAGHVTRATFLACYTGFASAYVGWSVMPGLTSAHTTAMAICGLILGYSSYATAWSLSRMVDVSKAPVVETALPILDPVLTATHDVANDEQAPSKAA